MTEPRAPFDALIVVGMDAEARIGSRLGTVLVGAAGLERALVAKPPSMVISFGLCGGLDPDLAVGDLIVGAAISGPDEAYQADPEWTGLIERKVEARRVSVAGTQTILASSAEKAALFGATGCAVADMESLAVAEAATRAGVPFAILRAISDGALDALPQSAVAGFREDGRADVAAVVRALARRPWEFPALIRTAANAQAALRGLGHAADRLSAGEAKPAGSRGA